MCKISLFILALEFQNYKKVGEQLICLQDIQSLSSLKLHI